jgi:four helix bundle protein
MRDFKDLLIWQRSHEFTLKIYKITSQFPGDERFGIISQLRRAVSSIPANIAEGAAFESKKVLKNHLNSSLGSASEVEYFIILSKDLKFISEKVFNELNLEIIEIKKMINKFIQQINKQIANS